MVIFLDHRGVKLKEIPGLIGTLFSLVLTQGHIALGLLYLLILMQFSFVVALYNVIGQQVVITR